jgi:hypothetical protein
MSAVLEHDERVIASDPAYVVVCQQLGSWMRGRVVRKSQFPEASPVQKFLHEAKIRVATDYEAGLDLVAMPEIDPHEANRSVDEKLLAERAKNGELLAKLASLESENIRLKSAPPTQYNPEQNLAMQQLLREKDLVLQDLQAKVKELTSDNERLASAPLPKTAPKEKR